MEKAEKYGKQGLDTVNMDMGLVITGQGMGLENLRARVAISNGVINVYSSPGNGTEVYVEIALLAV